MKVLVTGHKGFIGQHMTRTLLDLGHTVTGYDTSVKMEKPCISGYDWVIHLGANSSTVEQDVSKIMQQNFDESVYWFDQCLESGVGFQFASSASVYGRGLDGFTEGANPDPQNPYAWTKYLFERYVQGCGPYRKPPVYQLFRYFNVYGSGEDHKGNQMSPFSKFREQARNTGEIILFEGSERAQRDFVSVERVIDYHLRFMQVKSSGVFNIGSGKTTSFKEVAEMVAWETNAKIKTIPMPESIARNYQWYTQADMTQTENSLIRVTSCK